MEDDKYYTGLKALFEGDILVSAFEQGEIGMFEDIEYDFDETIGFIQEGKDVVTDEFNPNRIEIIVELYRETLKRTG